MMKAKWMRWWSVLLIGTAYAFASVAHAEETAPNVRLALVNIADDIVRPLLPGFTEQTGIAVDIVYMGSDPFTVASEGKADVVISHYGHPGVEPFVMGGRGDWPHPVFANQMALFGPANDPAGVRGMKDAAAAMAKVVASGAPYVSNASHGSRYLEEMLMYSAGSAPLKESEGVVAGKAAMDRATEQSAYVLWGVAPYLRYKQRNKTPLEPLVVEDPLFQRIMVSTVVKQGPQDASAEKAAEAFERYLISPQVQSRVRAFRYPGLPQPLWWPAGRHNGRED